MSALFLSTLSLRRATYLGAGESCNVRHFYPRSPCGERQAANGFADTPPEISIHALLAESDNPSKLAKTSWTISIHALLAESDLIISQHSEPNSGNFYPRSPCGERPQVFQRIAKPFRISIHALLAESDPKNPMIRIDKIPFLSTLSLRRATGAISQLQRILGNFYPRSPCGERPTVHQ